MNAKMQESFCVVDWSHVSPRSFWFCEVTTICPGRFYMIKADSTVAEATVNASSLGAMCVSFAISADHLRKIMSRTISIASQMLRPDERRQKTAICIRWSETYGEDNDPQGTLPDQTSPGNCLIPTCRSSNNLPITSACLVLQAAGPAMDKWPREMLPTRQERRSNKL